MKVLVTSPTSLGASVVLGNLLATVLPGAPYGAKALLSFVDVQIDQGSVPVRRDDGLVAIGYLGDASGDGSLSSLDYQRTNRLLLGQDSGLGAWPLIDPILLTDVDRNGRLTAADSLKILLQASGTPQKDIPPIPAGLPSLTFAGADPVISLGSATGLAGREALVPVCIDTAADLQSVVLTLDFDASRLRLKGVEGTALTAGFTARLTSPAVGRAMLDASAALPLDSGSGTLFWLRFEVLASAEPGGVPIDLVSARLNDTWLTLNPAPRIGPDITDGRVLVLATGTPAAAWATAGTGPAAVHGEDDEPSSSERPMLDFKRSASRGFTLGGSRHSLWLNDWIAEPAASSAARSWSITGKRPTVH
jgi:hypothetical protein